MSEGTTSVGIISLDLIITDTIRAQLDKIAGTANSSVQKSFSSVGDTIQEAVSKPLENVSKTLNKPLDNMKSQIKQSEDEISAIIKRANDKYDGRFKTASVVDDTPKISDSKPSKLATQIVDTSPVEGKIKAVKDGISNTLTEAEKMPEAFRAAADPVELLNQKLGNINSQIGEQEAKLQGLMAQYQQIASTKGVDSIDANKLDSEITGVQARLISLQQTANTSENTLNKALSAPALAAQKAQAAIERSNQKIRDTQAKTAQRAQEQIQKTVAKTSEATKTVKGKTSGMFASMNKGVSGFGRSIKSGLKSAFLMAGLYAFFKAFKSLMGDALSQNKEFSNSLNSVKANLSTAFQPILQAIMPALNLLMAGLASATKTIAAFISGLFGQTYKQSADAAKKLKDTSKQAAKTANAMSGLDELNVIDKDGSSEDKQGVDFSAVDTSGTAKAENAAQKVKAIFSDIGKTFDDFVMKPISDSMGKFKAPIEKFKTLFSGVFTQCKAWAVPITAWFQTDFKDALAVGIDNTTTVFAGLMDSLSMVANTIWEYWKPLIDWFVTDGLPMFTDIWVEWSNTVTKAFDVVKTVFDTLWKGVIEPVYKLISKIILDLFTTFQTLWEKYGATTFANIREALDTVKNLFLKVWGKFLKPIFDKIFEVLTALWIEHLQPLVAKIGEFIAKLVNGAMEIYNGFIAPIVSWFVDVFGPPIAATINFIIELIGSIIGTVADVASNIFSIFGGVIDFITGVFTGDWSKAWDGIKAIFKGVWDSFEGIVKFVVNIVIDLINGMVSAIETALNWIIKSINKISFTTPDWMGEMGGVTIGVDIPTVDIPKIPRLANGGLITQPTLGLMGEYPNARNNPEIVSPESKLRQIMRDEGGNNGNLANLMSEQNELLRAILDKDDRIEIGDDVIYRSNQRGKSKAGISVLKGAFANLY